MLSVTEQLMVNINYISHLYYENYSGANPGIQLERRRPLGHHGYILILKILFGDDKKRGDDESRQNT